MGYTICNEIMKIYNGIENLKNESSIQKNEKNKRYLECTILKFLLI